MTFRDLDIGAVFVFRSQLDPELQFSGMARGPWKKISARKYIHAEEPEKYGECRVGTINVGILTIQAFRNASPI